MHQQLLHSVIVIHSHGVSRRGLGFATHLKTTIFMDLESHFLQKTLNNLFKQILTFYDYVLN